MSARLDGRVAVVTGAARGLGAAICARLREAGAEVVPLDISLDPPCDVTDDASLAAAFVRLPRLDILVANAGLVPPWRDVAALDVAEWDRVFAVNVRGVALTMKHAIPRMGPDGSIIAIGSIMSEKAAARQALYTATKHAVLGLVRAAALELGGRGIRVNAIGPGSIATEALLGRIAWRAEQGIGPAPDAALAAMAAETPLGRLASDADVADAALYLASDLSRAVTGKLLRVDSGLP
jgi:NAD(P)-dependent dehydrogenase (short-subunit alcohol dehydrogenase family)